MTIGPQTIFPPSYRFRLIGCLLDFDHWLACSPSLATHWSISRRKIIMSSTVIFNWQFVCVCLSGISSWIMFSLTRTATVNWQTLACVKKAYLKASEPEPSAVLLITLPQRSVQTYRTFSKTDRQTMVDAFLKPTWAHVVICQAPPPSQHRRTPSWLTGSQQTLAWGHILNTAGVHIYLVEFSLT